MQNQGLPGLRLNQATANFCTDKKTVFIIEIIILADFPEKTVMPGIFCIAVFSRKFVKIIILIIKRSYIIGDLRACHTSLSELNFLFNQKLKTNLVTLRKCNLHLQYYKIDPSFNIKLQKINLNLCKEYKTEREARSNLRAMRMCP